MKHKVFYWLLLQNRLNTRGLLRRKNMHLESYTCDLCLLQRVKNLRHLFFRCPFAKNCWLQIEVLVPMWLKPDRATSHIRRKLRVPFAMEIIILMCWSIWKERNSWIFKNEDPSIEKCKINFKKDFALIIHRAKSRHKDDMESWLSSVT
jgi:hypothetical protein